MTHNLIFIHGMGEGHPNEYYKKLYDGIKSHMKNKKKFDTDFPLTYVEWDPAVYQAEKQISDHAFNFDTPSLSSVFNSLQQWKLARDFMTFFVGDIIAYTAENDNGIRKNVWNQIKETCKLGPYSIVAHSLGSVIAFDYLYKLFKKQTLLYPGEIQGTDEELKPFKENFCNIFTFGSPIGLFMLRQGNLWSDGKEPFSTIENPVSDGHTWLNFYDNQDIAAYPLEKLFAVNTENPLTLKDINVQTGNFGIDSHTQYWVNNDVAERIADVLNTWQD